MIEVIYDVKKWLTPAIATLHGHTQPLHFKFVRNEAGKALMYHRQWATDPWSKEGIVLLKVRTYVRMRTAQQVHTRHMESVCILNKTNIVHTYVCLIWPCAAWKYIL